MHYTMRLLLLVASGVSVCYGMEVSSPRVNTLPEPFCFIKAGDLGGLATCISKDPAGCEATLKQGDEHYTPLTYVFECFGRDLEQSALVHDLVDILLKAGADPNAGFVRKPIHYAAGCGLLSIVELLYKHKADVKALDAYGATALHYVAGCNDSLLRPGLRPRKKGSIVNRSFSPTDLVAPVPCQHNIINRLASRNSGELAAEEAVRALIAGRLLELGVDGDVLDAIGKAACDYAQFVGLKSVMARLIKKPE